MSDTVIAAPMDKPLLSHTVSDTPNAVCPWCRGRIRLEDEDTQEGMLLECPCCEREVRVCVRVHVTVYLYPKTS